MTRDVSVVWNRDPAASGIRWNAYFGPDASLPDFRLCVYEDGRWFVDSRGLTVAQGTAINMKTAKCIAAAVFAISEGT